MEGLNQGPALIFFDDGQVYVIEERPEKMSGLLAIRIPPVHDDAAKRVSHSLKKEDLYEFNRT